VVQLRRDKRRLEMENEILRRAAAYFARDALPLPSSGRLSGGSGDVGLDLSV